ncbi:autotransporter assembly complex protein TamA [Anaeromyxobacter oryzae]|uniref:Outer membrane protein assembly factor n=1 Tax=Anaeromyxobacter oryzae TaxID=2918170 RepID=A0ABM7WW34_9BACT|nr:BamA/TamA family outer membrane protein [Anaeromyxobacter oryzae]BDG03707.1 outer membrane protein assembly factor [Anaeromyxobacter oryzae]
MARPHLALLALALVLALGSGCMRARGTPDEPVVTALEIRGAKALAPDTIRKRLATQASGRYAWDQAIRLDPDALSVDRRRVEALYHANGYYDAEVKDVRLVPDGKGRVKVVIEVDEGAPVRVTALDVTGLDDTPDARARLGKLPLSVGDVFTVGGYDAVKAQILRTLRNSGWANAEVTQEAHVYPPEHGAEVRYAVKPGQRFKFGPIFVAGTAAIPRDRIRDQALDAVKPGDWYSDEALAKAQTRVFDLGVFGGVRVTRGTPDVQRGVIPVVVAVREAPFRTIRAGPGVGVEANTRWDVHGTAGWTNRNFYGDLRRLQLDLRVGYAWIFRANAKQGPVGLATTEFSQPGAVSRHIDAAVRLELERGLEQGYDFYSERLRFSFPLRIQRRWTLVPSYNLEVYQLFNVAENPTPSVPGQTGPQLQNCQGTVCLLSYLEQRVGWDGRNDPINTRKGVFVLTSFQEGFRLGRYGYRYLRVVPEGRFFVPLSEGVVLAARARVGALIPLTQSGAPPIVARFMAGGPQSMRGYYTNRLSPMMLLNGDWIPVGGNGLADGSLELRFDISGPIGGAVFLDAGNVSKPTGVPSEWRTVLDPTLLQWATGFGVRYRTPFGPVRLDVGVQVPVDWAPGVSFPHRFPTVPSVENAGEPIKDSTGAVIGTVPLEHREPWIAIHLSLGEAF